MFELKQVGTTHGDCTAAYNVIVDKTYTLGEFVDEILKTRSDERGAIKLHSMFGEVICKYDSGRLTKSIPSQYKDKVISITKADGGWTLMDYIIEFVREDRPAAAIENTCRYYSWRKDNEARYLKDPTLLEQGAFKDTCTDEILVERVHQAVEDIYNNQDANLLSAVMTFIQYLYEVHKLPAEDCELLGDIIITGMHQQMQSTANAVCETIIGRSIDISDFNTIPNKTANNVVQFMSRQVEWTTAQKNNFAAHFINQYFDPHFDVDVSITCDRLNVILILFYDKDHKRNIKPSDNYIGDYAPHVKNGIEFPCSVIEFVYNQMEDMLEKSGFCDEVAKLIGTYLYHRIDQNLIHEVKTAVDRLLWEYIDNRLPYRGKQELVKELISRIIETAKDC